MAKDKKLGKSVTDLLKYVHENVQYVNGSKLFAGLMIITLNIASRFVNIKLSKSVESYLKFTFSRQILVFAIAWMGTRDIYIAFIITIVFNLLFSYLLNEDSGFCILPETFTDYHIQKADNEVTDEDIKKAKEVLEKAENQKKTSHENKGGFLDDLVDRPTNKTENENQQDNENEQEHDVVGISTFSFK